MMLSILFLKFWFIEFLISNNYIFFSEFNFLAEFLTHVSYFLFQVLNWFSDFIHVFDWFLS
jgi:hypothetical protein